ncbi:MAG: HAMP domain-containing protein, partial [Actinobacteria bacterium]|nr:HAMP domain-containing protein [Actinomycetota bacterium]
TVWAELARGLGGLAVGVAAATGARQSIAARIAAAATALLLVVVLVLSAALSVVVTGNISDEALRRAEDRAASRATFVAGRADDAAGQSDVVVSVLSGAEVFRDAVRSDQYDAVQGALEGLLSIYRQVDFMSFVDSAGRARVGVGVDQSDFVELAGSTAVSDAIAGNAAASVDIVGSGLMALGAIPVSVPDARGAPQQVGAVVTGFRIDAAVLEELLQEERGTSFAVITRDRVLASTGERPPDSVRDVVGPALAPDVARRVLATGSPLASQTTVRGGDAFVAVAPIMASDGRTVAAFSVNIDTDLVDDTLASLFRTLFLVALGATAVAFLFATSGGARVTAPLRRLTVAAERVASGDLTARAEVESEDELGTLGASFDTMTASIEGMTREIREAAAQTAAILSGMADGLVAADPEGRVVALNPAAERMLGTKEARALGKPVAALVRGTENSGRPLEERLAAEMRRPWSVHGRVSRRRGELAVAISGAPIADDRGDLIGRVYVMRDIQREAEVEAMKSEFLANISHELRTPLTPIKGYVEVMLARDVPKSRQRQFLGTILESAERLERYVDMLVNFSAMEAGRFELQTSEVDVGALVRRVVERWRSKTRAHRFALAAAARLPRVTADERLLERAVNEIVDNAVKYSPNGGPIEVSTRIRGTGTGRRVEIVVADRGIGVEAADLDAIFADFSQVDGSSTRRFGGLGLGLSFVHRVVRAHQGTLEAASTPGAGSTFTIALPPSTRTARPSSKSTRVRVSREARAPAPRGTRRTRGRT